MSETTDAERLDRLPLIIHRLRDYNWKAATPFITRVAIDLAWLEHQEEAEAMKRANECGTPCGAFLCARPKGHKGRHAYTRRNELSSPPSTRGRE